MRKNSKKAGVEILFIILAGLLFFHIADKEKSAKLPLQLEEKEFVLQKDMQENNSEIDNIQFYQNTIFLRDVLFLDSLIDETGTLSFSGLYDYSEEVKGEFSPVLPEDCSIPEGLVTVMEEAFYNSANAKTRDGDNCFYDKTIKEFGGDDFKLKLEDAYELFPRISEYREQIENEYDAYSWIAELYLERDSKNCIDIFHLDSTGGQDYYVFSYQSGGTSRAIYLYLMERIGDEFVEVDIFGTTSYGRGTVIKYDEKFYYVALEMNDYLKDYDGVQIYSLNEDVQKNNLSIRYLPEKYVWSALYQLDGIEDGIKEELDLYVEKIKEEFTPGTYLGDGMHVYYGDETKEPSVESVRGRDNAYLVDIANCGRPVYICKQLTCPNCCKQYLNFMIFSYPLYGESIEEPSEDINIEGVVQTWFKEIRGKVYTCQIYHSSDYNYIFRMLLLEDDKVTVVRTEMIAPQRKFTTEHGFYWGM